MISKLYNDTKRIGVLNNKYFILNDYFTYYTGGVQSIINDNLDAFAFTKRLDNERPEQIAHDLYTNKNLSDMIIALNNQNYLFGAPMDGDTYLTAIDFRYAYVEKLMNDRLNSKYDNNQESIDIIKERVEESIDKINENSKRIIIPTTSAYQAVLKNIDKYFKSRKVT